MFTIYIVLRHTLAAVGVDNDLWLGVEFFFVLSGFLLSLTYRDQDSVFNFVLRKYLRFVPLVAFGCLLCAFVRPFSPLLLVSNLLLLSETGAIVSSGAFNPPTWYLSVLLFGSAVIFMIIKYFNSRWAIISIGVMIGLAYLRRYGYEACFSAEVPNSLLPHRFIRGLTEMGVGCIAGRLFAGSHLRVLKKLSTLKSILFWLLLVSVVLGPVFPLRYHAGCITLLVFACAALLYLIASGDNVLNRSIWGKLSRYALAVFTTHYFTTFLLFKFKSGCYYEGGRAYIAAIVAVFLSLAIGVLAHHFVERPSQRIVRRLLEGERNVRQ